MTAQRFNPAPGWPTPPEGWVPPKGWQPSEDWPEAPEGWEFWIPVEPGRAPRSTDVISGIRTARGQSVITENAVLPPTGASAQEVLWEGASSMLTGIGGGRYRLTRHHLYFESGVLRTDSSQIPVENIYDIDVSASLMQKSRGVANVFLHITHPNNVSETMMMENLTDAKNVQGIINEAIRARRLELTYESNTHRYSNGQPLHIPPTTASLPVVEKKPDIIQQIAQLGELHNAGVLTQEEFETKKAELLSRL